MTAAPDGARQGPLRSRLWHLMLISALVLPLLIVVDQAPVAAAQTATVTSSLRLRSGPSTGFRILAVMPQGESVTVLEGPTNGWYRVQYRSMTGWASAEYLTVAGTGTPTPSPGGTGAATVNTDRLNLRSGPSTSSGVIRVLNRGERVAIVSGPSNGWYQITYGSITGWVSGQYLSIGTSSGSPTTPPTVATSATVDVDRLNLRSGPATSTSSLTRMLYGETVKIIGTSGEWYQVTYHGRTGWAFGSYLRFGGDSASFAVPIHQQEHSLSCEYASLQIASAALGREIPEDRFIPVVGKAANPHNGFRGNIDATYIFGTDDYGVYPEALAKALPSFGLTGEVMYGGTEKLKSYLKAGTPVVIWIDLGFDTSFTMMIDGQPVTMAPRSHVVVAYGYSSAGVLISDPDSNTPKRLIPWRDFNVMWSSMDQMALAVRRA